MTRLGLITCLLLPPLASAGGAVFDAHVHLREGETSLYTYRAEARESGIELSGLAVMWFGGPHQALAGNPADIRARNDELVALAARHRDVVPIATVHPYDGLAAQEELARVAARGVKVLKLHPHTQAFELSDARVLALVRKAGELGVTVLIDNGGVLPGDGQDHFNLAVRAPKTRFIFAHLGGLDFRFWNILEVARTADGFALENVCFDISATLLLAADSPLEEEFVWTLRNVGIDRLLLGSDYPQITLARAVHALERLDLSPEEKAAIQSGNARRLFGAPAGNRRRRPNYRFRFLSSPIR